MYIFTTFGKASFCLVGGEIQSIEWLCLVEG